ncbi:MAG: hypothetical protein D3904_14935 [Candidatus Electrothrix sp. EH2]|nr:hypothetical protein [Candidatus Electrothrix sp. EH2]
MSAIHCKVEINSLTVPESRKLRFVPNNNLETDDIAEEMCVIESVPFGELFNVTVMVLPR